MTRPTADSKTLGDPLPLPNEYEAATEADVARLFGREFPKKLSGLPVGRWSGPVESGVRAAPGPGPQADCRATATARRGARRGPERVAGGAATGAERELASPTAARNTP